MGTTAQHVAWTAELSRVAIVALHRGSRHPGEHDLGELRWFLEEVSGHSLEQCGVAFGAFSTTSFHIVKGTA